MFTSIITAVVTSAASEVETHRENKRRREQGLPEIPRIQIPVRKEPERDSCGPWIAAAFIFGMML